MNPYLILVRQVEALNFRLALREYHRDLTAPKQDAMLQQIIVSRGEDGLSRAEVAA